MLIVVAGPLPAKELVDKLMTEESYSVTAKDSKVAAAEMTSSSASSPWSAEEQKVELIFCMMLNYQLFYTY